MNLSPIEDDLKELTSSAVSPLSTRSTPELRRKRSHDQYRALVVVFCLMLASGHTLAWLFFSKYL